MIHAPSPQHGCRQHREDAGMNVQGIRTEPGDLGQPYLGLPPGLRELGEISKVRKIHRETPTPKRDTGAADRGPVRRYPSKGNPSRIFLPIRPTIRRSEEHTSELQSLMRISYAVFCLKKKKKQHQHNNKNN